LEYQKIGRHYGKNKALKVLGLTIRAMQIVHLISKEKPDVALSHGSRSQLIAANFLGITSIILDDYEHSKPFPFVHPKYVILPEVIPEGTIKSSSNCVLKYPGIKEDVYVPHFEPDPSIRKQIGIAEDDLVIIVRPPATEAHYHKPESETFFIAALNYLLGREEMHMKVVILPRNDSQLDWMRKVCPGIMEDTRFLIPKEVLNGLNLIWHSDLVISGGGTMNREAVALGVPVYSIFRGKIGAVDRYLSQKGRLILIESEDQIYSKIVLAHRNKSYNPQNRNNSALQKIVSHILNIVES
jgi:predicted glycosyltransferase